MLSTVYLAACIRYLTLQRSLRTRFSKFSFYSLFDELNKFCAFFFIVSYDIATTVHTYYSVTLGSQWSRTFIAVSFVCFISKSTILHFQNIF